MCQWTGDDAVLHKTINIFTCFSQLVMKPQDCYTSDRSAAWQHLRDSLCGCPEAYQSLLYGSPELALRARYAQGTFALAPYGGLLGVEPKYGYSCVDVPGKCHLCYFLHIHGLVQERRNSSALVMEFRLYCTNPLIWFFPCGQGNIPHCLMFLLLGPVHNILRVHCSWNLLSLVMD